MKPMGSVAAVVAAMRDDASVEVERLEQDAAAQAGRIASRPKAETGDPDADARVLAARREAAEMRAREDWADARAMLEAREQFLQEVVAEGRRKLAIDEDTSNRRAWLAKLVREGTERLGGGEVVIEVAPADAPLVAHARGSAEVRLGCIVRAADGKSWFDNRIEERERRFEPAWRALLGRTYWP